MAMMNQFQGPLPRNRPESERRLRERFELWATECYEAAIGDRLDRDSHFQNEYKYADVHAAWRAWQQAFDDGLETAASIADKHWPESGHVHRFLVK
jgi:hypothetical protein